MNVTIERAHADDTPAVFALLEANHLPITGLRDHFATAIVAKQGNRVVGSAALELYADGVLPRSVAVAPDYQRKRLGHNLTDAALRLADQLRAPAVFLLTTTAENYFPKFGFERIARDEVPPCVRTSVEFTSACPSSATVMRKRL